METLLWFWLYLQKTRLSIWWYNNALSLSCLLKWMRFRRFKINKSNYKKWLSIFSSLKLLLWSWKKEMMKSTLFLIQWFLVKDSPLPYYNLFKALWQRSQHFSLVSYWLILFSNKLSPTLSFNSKLPTKWISFKVLWHQSILNSKFYKTLFNQRLNLEQAVALKSYQWYIWWKWMMTRMKLYSLNAGPSSTRTLRQLFARI